MVISDGRPSKLAICHDFTVARKWMAMSVDLGCAGTSSSLLSKKKADARKRRRWEILADLEEPQSSLHCHS